VTADRNSQGGAGNYAGNAASLRGGAFDAQVRSEYAVQIFLNKLKPLRKRPHHPPPRIASLTKPFRQTGAAKLSLEKNDGILDGITRPLAKLGEKKTTLPPRTE
jgi:hypothetical protein